MTTTKINPILVAHWVRNTSADEIMQIRRHGTPEQKSELARYQQGPPRQTSRTFSVQDLVKIGMIGLYEKGME